MKKIILSVVLIMASLFLISCGDITTGTTTQSQTTTEGNTTQDQTTTEDQTTDENTTTEESTSLVKVKSIKTVEKEPSTVKMAKRSVNLMSKTEKENIQYILLYKKQTDITFTIELDNPGQYAIKSLRVTCDDPGSQIFLASKWETIQRESDGTIMINWASENPYIKTYQIRTTSEDAINSFRVVDIWLEGHDKFQSEETESVDLGNNELKIYKILSDAYTVETVADQLDLKTLAVNVKDKNISNLKLNGVAADENGHWNFNASGTVTVEYDYTIPGIGVTLSRSDEIDVEVIKFVRGTVDCLSFIEYSWKGYTEITFAFYINAKYTISINGENLEFYFVDSENDATTFKTTKTISELSNFRDAETGAFSSEEDLVSFMEAVRVKIGNKTYKLDYDYIAAPNNAGLSRYNGLIEVQEV